MFLNLLYNNYTRHVHTRACMCTCACVLCLWLCVYTCMHVVRDTTVYVREYVCVCVARHACVRACVHVSAFYTDFTSHPHLQRRVYRRLRRSALAKQICSTAITARPLFIIIDLREPWLASLIPFRTAASPIYMSMKSRDCASSIRMRGDCERNSQLA